MAAKPATTEDTVCDINGNEISKGSAVRLVLKVEEEALVVAAKGYLSAVSLRT